MIKLTVLCVLLSALLITASCAGKMTAPAPETADPEATPVFNASAEFEATPLSLRSSQNGAGLDEGVLYIPETFGITRPDSALTTAYDKYFITGTSDPKIPVYFGDDKINRVGKKGTFGVLADLEMGENSFVFSQGGDTRTVTIIRREPDAGNAAPITGILQDSMIPSAFSGVRAGGQLDVGCIAPSGAKVTAEFAGRTVRLRQVDETAKTGIPAFFKARIEVDGNYDKSVTQNAGKVLYRMTAGNGIKSYESDGDVFVAGKNSNIAVRVSSYMGFVYENTKDLSVFRERLKCGATDYMRSQDNKYVELASGGYIVKEQLEVLEGRVRVGNKLGRVQAEFSEKGESLIFNCPHNPAYVTRFEDGKFTVTLFNTAGAPDVGLLKSKLFSGVEVTRGLNDVTYAFALADPGKLWGYNVSYGEKSMELYFRYRPFLSQGAKPLENITILLDPGHGGKDRGALGVAHITGPTEADVNLAHTKALAGVLTDLGANVALTRRTDLFYSLDARLKAPEENGADLFLSLHHNSIGENADANTIEGMEIYYHTAFSQKNADTIITSVSARLGRPIRFVNRSYYRVTLSPYCPSMLFELGFMSNPLEYERAASKEQIDKAARAIADGIVRALS